MFCWRDFSHSNYSVDGIFPLRVNTSADGIFPTWKTVSRRSVDGIFPTQNHSAVGYPTRSQSSADGIFSIKGLCFYAMLIGFSPLGDGSTDVTTGFRRMYHSTSTRYGVNIWFNFSDSQNGLVSVSDFHIHILDFFQKFLEFFWIILEIFRIQHWLILIIDSRIFN